MDILRDTQKKTQQINMISARRFKPETNIIILIRKLFECIKPLSIHRKRISLYEICLRINSSIIELIFRHINTHINHCIHFYFPFIYSFQFKRVNGAVLISNLLFDSGSKTKSTYWNFEDSEKSPVEVLRLKKMMSLLSLSPFKSIFQLTKFNNKHIDNN